MCVFLDDPGMSGVRIVGHFVQIFSGRHCKRDPFEGASSMSAGYNTRSKMLACVKPGVLNRPGPRTDQQSRTAE